MQPLGVRFRSTTPIAKAWRTEATRMSTKTGVTVNNLSPEEQLTANIAWWLAQGISHPPHENAYGVLFMLGSDGATENYRMQSFIREWAAFGYAPAQSLLAKVAVKRLGI